MAASLPLPSGSVLDRGIRMRIPSLVSCTFSTVIPANSDRRKAPAKPTSRRARSRIPSGPSGSVSTMARRSPVNKRVLARRFGSVDAADALERFAYAEVLGECRSGLASRTMHLINGGQTPGERGGPVGSGGFPEVEGDGVGRGREGGKALLPAPLL